MMAVRGNDAGGGIWVTIRRAQDALTELRQAFEDSGDFVRAADILAVENFLASGKGLAEWSRGLQEGPEKAP
jgi:hypothetical protein